MADSTLANLTAITNLADSDLLYVVQNSTDYKMTNAQLVNFAKSKIVVALTQAQYDNLSPAEKNNGSVYVITDATFDLGDLSDVTITGTPSAGEVLVADGSGGWENGDIPVESDTITIPTYGGQVILAKFGRVVTITVQSLGSTSEVPQGTSLSLNIIPAKYRPLFRTFSYGTQQGNIQGNNAVRYTFESDGRISTYAYSAINAGNCTATFISAN